MKLVVVESPAKCAKIQSYLGDGYKVQATMGHIRALEESLDSVGIDKGWEPTFAEIKTKKEAIAKLRAAAKGCEVILAADDDREGEAIAWHVCFILKLNPATTQRIVFHEITKPAILAAAASPRRLDMNKVNAQQARSMLDLLVGFTISKVLWNRVGPKLSAGRCQTPALRLVVERDAEVDNHKAAAYWRLSGSWLPTATITPLEAVAAVDLATQDDAQKALQTVVNHTASTVVTVKESVSTSSPPKPLITSTLQQEASNQCGINPKTTMQAAQKLYEAGHITYMRTDNPLISEEAAAVIRTIVKERYGEDYVGAPGQHILQAMPEAKEAKEAKKAKAPVAAQPQAQAAHEAIRPTHPEVEPDIDDPTQKRVYRLIWRRAMESQMSASQTDVKKATLVINADKERVWNTEQTKMKFAGWKVLEPKSDDATQAETTAWSAWAPYLKPGTALQWQQLRADEQFTKPKGRYTEASLISDLEKRGIGRPSTFASLVSTILEREYVEKTNAEGKTQESTHLVLKPAVWPPTVKTEAHKVGADKNKLKATPLGKSVSDFLAREYTDLFNYQFTATMEQRLDEIAQGTHPWKSLLQTTWDTYKERYAGDTSGPSKASKERELAPGVKVILSRKGPLFVKEPPAGSPKTAKATFASLPSTTTFETATIAEAEAAFAATAHAKAGELIGHLETDEIRKKTGPYGQYAECKGSRVPIKGDETLEQIQEKLTAKIGFTADVSGAVVTAFDRTVGDYRIKRGPYGLYFYKHTLKRATFIKFPPQLNAETITLADLNGLYSHGLANKRKFGKK
jgi:DNA topoisomerase-1